MINYENKPGVLGSRCHNCLWSTGKLSQKKYYIYYCGYDYLYDIYKDKLYQKASILYDLCRYIKALKRVAMLGSCDVFRGKGRKHDSF